MKTYYELRSRADGDGYTLLRHGIAIAGGSFQTCISALQNDHASNGAENVPPASCAESDDAIFKEVERAVRKFPTWPTDPLHALAVLGEEFGELTKEVVQLTYEPHKSSFESFRKEAVQTAAMAVRFLRSIDTYEFRAGPQHSQSQP